MARRVLLAGAAFVAVTVVGFALASSVGDQSATPAGGDANNDVASKVALAGTGADPAVLADGGPQLVSDGVGPSTIVGAVTAFDGMAVSGAEVYLFDAGEDDQPADLVHVTATGGDGAYEIPAPVGCYVVRLVAPAGRSFVNAGPSIDTPTCVNATIVRITIDAQLAP